VTHSAHLGTSQRCLRGRVLRAHANSRAASAGHGGDEAASRCHSIHLETRNAERASRISTKNAEALQGVRKFLRFQIATIKRRTPE